MQYNCRSLRCSWSIACRRCSNYIWVIDLTSGFKGFGKDSHRTVWESFKCWDLVRLILETWRYTKWRVKNCSQGIPCHSSQKLTVVSHSWTDPSPLLHWSSYWQHQCVLSPPGGAHVHTHTACIVRCLSPWGGIPRRCHWWPRPRQDTRLAVSPAGCGTGLR